MYNIILIVDYMLNLIMFILQNQYSLFSLSVIYFLGIIWQINQGEARVKWGQLGLKKVFDWRNPTDPRYPIDPTYLLLIFQQKYKFTNLQI